MSTVSYESIETLVTKDLSTQEATHVTERTTRSIRLESEDAYIKVYLKDIHLLHNLSPQTNKFMYEFFGMANWNTNEIQITAGKKNELAKKYNTSKAVIDNIISKLTKNEIMIKKGTGLYILNPHIFGKGTWASIRALRFEVDFTFSTGATTLPNEETIPMTRVEEEILMQETSLEFMEGLESPEFSE